MWGWFNEKSKQSKKIEDAICKQFDELRIDIDAACCHRDVLSVLAIGCKSKESPLRILSDDVMRRITSYLDIPCSSNTSTRRRRVFDGLLKPRISTEMSTTMFEPGSVTVIPIARHPFHLTRPCYRDFARYVRKFDGFHSSRLDVDAVNIVYKTPRPRPSGGGCQIESIARSIYLAMVVAIESDVEDAILFQTALDVGFSNAFILSLKGRGGTNNQPDEDCDGMEGCDE